MSTKSIQSFPSRASKTERHSELELAQDAGQVTLPPFFLIANADFNASVAFTLAAHTSLAVKFRNTPMFVVGSLMQLTPILNVVIPPVLASSIKRPGILFNCLSQYTRRLFARVQLDADSSLPILGIALHI